MKKFATDKSFLCPMKHVFWPVLAVAVAVILILPVRDSRWFAESSTDEDAGLDLL